MSYPITSGCWYDGDAMADAPIVTGSSSTYDIVNLLEKCLGIGFNSKSVSTLSRTSTIATATYDSPHGYVVNQIIDLSSVNETGWNDRWQVATVPGGTSLTFAVPVELNASPTGSPVTITAPAWKNPAWSGNVKFYTGTGKAAFKILDPAGSGYFLRVLDTFGTYAQLRGYSSMSNVDTGTGGFYDSNEQFLYRSNVANTTPRRWRVVADSRFVMVFMIWHDASYRTNVVEGSWFGDVVPFSSGSANAHSIIASAWATESIPNANNNTFRIGQSFTSDETRGIYFENNATCFKDGPTENIISSNKGFFGANNVYNPYPFPANPGLNDLILLEKVRVRWTNHPQGTLPSIRTPLNAWDNAPDAFTTITLQGIPYLVIKDNYTSSKQHWYLVKMVGDLRV